MSKNSVDIIQPVEYNKDNSFKRRNNNRLEHLPSSERTAERDGYNSGGNN